MAQISFTSIPDTVDNQTVEVDLQHFLQSAVIINDNIETASGVSSDEGDVFQCGKCKRLFTNVTAFFSHKNGNCLGLFIGNEEETHAGELTKTYTTIPILDSGGANSSQPIIINNNEILSFTVNSNAVSTDSYSQHIDTVNNKEDNHFVNKALDISSLKPVCLVDNAEMFNVPQKFILQQNQDWNSVLVDKNVDETVVLSILKNESKVIGKSAINYKVCECTYCGKQFRKKSHLDEHLRSHTGERPFQCIVCGRAFAQKSNMMKHMTTHKVWPKKLISLPSNSILQMQGSENSTLQNKSPNNELDILNIKKTFACQFCPSVFNSFLKLKAHRKAHKSQKVYKCVKKDCNITFEDLDRFLEHSKSHVNDGQYECLICHFEFNSLANLGNHLATHDTTNKSSSKTVLLYTCRKCNGRFTSSESLNRHLSSESHCYPCSICHKVFTCERFLRRHIQTHTTAAKFTCQICKKSFMTEDYLNTHTLMHSNLKPYTCQICPASFKRKDRLYRHNLTHENERKFKCPFSKKLGCEKEFHRRDKLEAHILTHGSSKKTYCQLCSDYIFKKVNISKNYESLCNSHKKEFLKDKNKLNHVDFKIIESKDHKLCNQNLNSDQVPDDVPTIEIVVMPVTAGCTDQSDGPTFRVMFPPESENPVDLSNDFGTASDQEVPIYTIKPFK